MLSVQVLDFAKKEYAKSSDRVVVVGDTIYINPTDEFLSTLDEEIAVVTGPEFVKEEKKTKIKKEEK